MLSDGFMAFIKTSVSKPQKDSIQKKTEILDELFLWETQQALIKINITLSLGRPLSRSLIQLRMNIIKIKRLFY